MDTTHSHNNRIVPQWLANYVAKIAHQWMGHTARFDNDMYKSQAKLIVTVLTIRNKSLQGAGRWRSQYHPQHWRDTTHETKFCHWLLSSSLAGPAPFVEPSRQKARSSAQHSCWGVRRCHWPGQAAWYPFENSHHNTDIPSNPVNVLNDHSSEAVLT